MLSAEAQSDVNIHLLMEFQSRGADVRVVIPHSCPTLTKPGRTCYGTRMSLLQARASLLFLASCYPPWTCFGVPDTLLQVVPVIASRCATPACLCEYHHGSARKLRSPLVPTSQGFSSSLRARKLREQQLQSLADHQESTLDGHDERRLRQAARLLVCCCDRR